MKMQGIGSVFKRLVWMFVLVIVLIYAVICVVFVQYVNEQRNAEISKQQNRVISSARVLEQQIQAIFNMELQWTQDSRLTQLAYGVYPNAYERSQLILELQELIQGGRSVNSIIEDVLLIFPKEGVEISAKNGYLRREYLQGSLLYEKSTKGNRLIYGDVLELNIISPFVLAEEELPQYIIRIILSENYMNEYIDTLRNTQQGVFWVLHQDDADILLAPYYEQSPEFSENNFSASRNVSEMELMAHWSKKWNDLDRPLHMSDKIKIGSNEYLFVSESIPDFNLILVAYQNKKEMFGNTEPILFHFGVAIIFIGILFGLALLWANRTVGKPLQKVVNAFAQVQGGDLDVRIYHNSKDEFHYIYQSFNDTIVRIKALMDNIKEQSELLQNAELMQLQSQINPHFLYNSFYIIKFMAQKEDYEKIEDFVTSLARYYRFLNKETSKFIPLYSEVEHMENYIDIQQMRFSDKISVKKASLPDEVRNFKVPKLILQPIIENAYGYGLSSLLQNGLLKINYCKDCQYLYIEIEDNGNVLTMEQLEAMRENLNSAQEAASSHALANIARRLTLAYGKADCLRLEIGGMGGLKVTLCLDTKVELE